ncbi:MAG TPA: isoprenylcysteine carboxylmethyltransferase family protein [Dongiaceae bacterium]|nr:isoprenylcysteine carboxylmethyltransferase family protein [Dongiaceae bacterium]
MSAPSPGAPGTVTRPRSPAITVLMALVAVALDAAFLALALGGVRALLAHHRALALLGIYVATGVPLALLRPVRDQDVVRSNPDPWWRLLLLFLIPLAIPPLSAYGERVHAAALPPVTWLGWLGLALTMTGLVVRILAMVRLGPRFAPIPALQRGHALETAGPYAHVRHPGYLGSWLAAFGAMLVFRNGLAMPLFVVFSWLLAVRARHEDALLETHFGDAYRAWAARTGAFLPGIGRR